MSIKKIFSSDKNRLFQTSEYDYINNASRDPSSKNILKNNGGNIIYKDYSCYTIPNKNSEKSTNNTAYGLESKINELECKIISLEEKNELLLTRLNNTEQVYDSKIRKLEKNNIEDKSNIMNAQQTMALLNQKNNENSNDVKNKLNFIHNTLQKEEEIKNEQRKIDIELQKNILNKILEKLGETVKAEVDARFKADIETKAYNQNIYKNMENDLNKLKKEIEEINKQIHTDIKTVSKDCSERAHNISKYIDQQITNAVFGKNDSIDKVKVFIDQMIAKLKTNISSQNEQNKLFDQRLKNVEIHVEKSKNDNFGYMSEVEKRFDNKMKYLKSYFEVNLQKHDNFLDDTIKNMAVTMDKNINFLINQIIETRIKENEVYEKINTLNDNKFKAVIEDIEKIYGLVHQYENLLIVFDKQNDLLKRNVMESIAMVKSRFDVHIVNEKILYRVENDVMQEKITFLEKKLENSNAELIKSLSKLDQGSQNSIGTILVQLDQHLKMINNSDKVNNDKFEKLNKRNDENEVKILMNQMINNIEGRCLFDSLQDSKESENKINKIIEKHKEDIIKLNNETSTNKNNTEELTKKVNNMSDILNSSGSNLTKAMDDIYKIQQEAKEYEMKESVSKIMDLMLTNIENEITSEKMDDMNKFNLKQMTINISNLKNEINTLNSSTSTNSTDISNLKESVETIKKRGLDTQGNHSDCSLKISMNQMLNNVEFNNIYSLLKEGIKNSPIEFSDEMKKKCGELVDNKIQTELEKIKLDNQKMWDNAVEQIQKFSKPGEIQEILNKVPPTILNINESSKRLLDVDYFNGKNASPKVPDLDNKLKSMESEQDENIKTDVNKSLNINKKDPNEDNKENDKDKEIENDTDMVQIESTPDSQNQNKLFGKDVEKNSKGSKGSNNSKVSKNSKGSKKSQESKKSKGSKNSKVSKNNSEGGSKNSKVSKNNSEGGSKNSQVSKNNSEGGSKNSKSSKTISEGRSKNSKSSKNKSEGGSKNSKGSGSKKESNNSKGDNKNIPNNINDSEKNQTNEEEEGNEDEDEEEEEEEDDDEEQQENEE